MRPEFARPVSWASFTAVGALDGPGDLAVVRLNVDPVSVPASRAPSFALNPRRDKTPWCGRFHFWFSMTAESDR